MMRALSGRDLTGIEQKVSKSKVMDSIREQAMLWSCASLRQVLVDVSHSMVWLETELGWCVGCWQVVEECVYWP